MSNEMNEQAEREGVLADNVKGYTPLNLDECMDVRGNLNPDKAKKVLGDVLLCEVLDENEIGEVNRDGIWIKDNMGTKTWRRGRVVKCGSQCTDTQVNDIVIYPSDRGLKMISANGKKYIFLNESRIFYIEE